MQSSSTLETPSPPRVICYHQTHFQEGRYVPILPLISENTGITDMVLAAIHLNQPDGHITLNDDAYRSPRLNQLWQDVHALQAGGIRVLGMLGGAAKGSYALLDGEQELFEVFYEPLRQMVLWSGLDGLDLDVEEEMSLVGIIRLIDRLKTDFGDDFLITLAPVATALQNREHLSGFDYRILESTIGDKIAWYNAQFYCGWGSIATTEGYDEIIRCGWPPEKVVMGMVTNPANGAGFMPDLIVFKTMRKLLQVYPKFGGVMGWEYFNSRVSTDPYKRPWSWAKLMSGILKLP